MSNSRKQRRKEMEFKQQRNEVGRGKGKEKGLVHKRTFLPSTDDLSCSLNLAAWSRTSLCGSMMFLFWLQEVLLCCLDLFLNLAWFRQVLKSLSKTTNKRGCNNRALLTFKIGASHIN